jgi:hypothetical protein
MCLSVVAVKNRLMDTFGGSGGSRTHSPRLTVSEGYRAVRGVNKSPTKSKQIQYTVFDLCYFNVLVTCFVNSSLNIFHEETQILYTVKGTTVVLLRLGDDLFSMQKRVPMIDGKMPKIQYDLDNENHLRTLGLDPNAELKIADLYVQYHNGKWAVIECGATLRKGIEQVASTAERLKSKGWNVDLLIIVVDRLNRWEQKMFKRKHTDNILLNRVTSKPYLVRASNKIWSVLLFYSSELDKMSQGMYKYI